MNKLAKAVKPGLAGSDVRQIVGVVSGIGAGSEVAADNTPAAEGETAAATATAAAPTTGTGGGGGGGEKGTGGIPLAKTVKAIQRFRSASSDNSIHHPQEVAEKLMTQCKRGDWAGAEDTCLEAVKHGVDTDVRADGTGWTPLHFAAKDNQARIAEHLLDLGFDINAQATDGVTPLHLACAFAREDTIRILLSRQADTLIVGGVCSLLISIIIIIIIITIIREKINSQCKHYTRRMMMFVMRFAAHKTFFYGV